ncbi:hypothetical protein LLG95_02170 [bacterium]|nr:hypothetical protein [bacterium]
MRQYRPILVLSLLFVLTLCGCGKGKSSGTGVTADGRVASATIPLGSNLVQLTGKLEGPLTFEKMLTPCVVQAHNMGGETIKLTLLGLREGSYPRPPDPKDKRTPQEKKAEAQQFHKFKMDEMGKLIGMRPIYVIRMGPGDARTPPPCYAFLTDSKLDNPAAPTESGELLNALALRRGIANMELDSPDHPMREIMLECQAAAVVEARRAAAGGRDMDSIWRRFPIQMPAEYEPQIDRIDKKI